MRGQSSGSISIPRTTTVFKYVSPVVLLLGICAGESAAQNLVDNGSFETPPAGGSFVSRSGPNAMGAWSVLGNVDHIGGFWTAAEASQSVDLNGSAAGTIYQTIITQPGRAYRVRFALSENFFGYADKTLDILWDQVVVQSVVVTHDPGRTTSDMRWSYAELTVTAASTTSEIAFRSTTGSMDGSQGNQPFYGPAIDDVSVALALCSPCDANCDGSVNQFDIQPFVDTLISGSGCSACAADTNTDGSINQFDIQGFIGCLGG